MKKIPLYQLAAYLPYKVKAQFNETNKKGCKTKVIGTVSAVYDNCTICCHDTVNVTPDKFKLVLKPISSSFPVNFVNYKTVQEQLKKHYDIFGLISQGLAVDFNTLTP